MHAYKKVSRNSKTIEMYKIVNSIDDMTIKFI